MICSRRGTRDALHDDHHANLTTRAMPRGRLFHVRQRLVSPVHFVRLSQPHVLADNARTAISHQFIFAPIRPIGYNNHSCLA